ncbi:MAG: DUF3791 domain-containing protein [Eubacteriales bacterium]|nr:DUF3791 domain-containing protein [Eubacteriales bacterium]
MRKQINYTVACVNGFAERKHIHPSEAFLYLYQHDGISFLRDCYDIEHTLFIDDALDDLEIICRQHGGALP